MVVSLTITNDVCLLLGQNYISVRPDLNIEPHCKVLLYGNYHEKRTSHLTEDEITFCIIKTRLPDNSLLADFRIEKILKIKS